MNFLTIILTIILSFLSVSEKSEFVSDSQKINVAASSTNQDMCITAAVGTTFTGESGYNYISFRTTSSGYRIHSSIKSQIRLIKAGKVIDTNHIFRDFFFSPLLPSDGIASRYIYSICCLRI